MAVAVVKKAALGVLEATLGEIARGTGPPFRSRTLEGLDFKAFAGYFEAVVEVKIILQPKHWWLIIAHKTRAESVEFTKAVARAVTKLPEPVGSESHQHSFALASASLGFAAWNVARGSFRSQ